VLGGHTTWLAWLSASPLLGLLLIRSLARAAPDAPAGTAADGAGTRGALAALAPSLVLLVVTLAGGGVMTFLPIERPEGVLATAALLVFGVTGAVTRWGAGLLADRVGSRLLLPVCLVGSAAGLLLLAAGLPWGAGWVLAGAAVFGAGYGGVQNLTLLLAFSRAGRGGATAASAMWNAAFDAGMATGALALGLAAAGIGLSWTFVVVAGLLVAVLPLATAATRPADVS
jgi:predicted MFS family arabinose efflux permease